jgi:D-amino-acid dehydrogenase
MSPLYLPLRWDPSLMWWMWKFKRACTKSHFERSTRFLARLGHAAGECFREILDEEPIECSHRFDGWYEVFLDEGTLKHGEHDAALLEDAGFETTHLDGDELREREPAFGEAIIGGVQYHNGVSLDPGDFLRGLADSVRGRGVEVEMGVSVAKFVRDGGSGRVTAVATDDGRRFEGDTFVVAAGSWTTALAREIGVRIPMQPGKGYHVNTPPLDPPLRTACVLADRHIAVTPMGDRMRLAGTVELSGMNLRLHPRRVEMLAEGAEPFLPGVTRVEPSAGWCGLRPCTADGLPVVGWAPEADNVFIATGHTKMGLTLLPITGRLAAEWITDGQPSMDLAPLSPARF